MWRAFTGAPAFPLSEPPAGCPHVSSLSLRLPPISRDLALVLSLRLWQAGAGLLTTILAVHFLTPELQGWYYSFISVAALYTLFDLGLSMVLVQVSAHAFTGLKWISDGRVEGEASPYFQALVHRASRWYASIALLFALTAVPGGMVFFGTKPAIDVHWLAPWLTLCALTASGLVVMPFLSILEGAGQITHVYAVRLALAVTGSISCWLTLASGAGLWATAMVPAMTLLVPLAWLLRRRRGLISLAIGSTEGAFDWRHEVWPLQWRLGINLLCGYLLTQINIPVLFHTQGPVIAGQLGLSLAIVNTLGLVAQSWITRRVPLMARAAVTRDWPLLDRLFKRDFLTSSAIFVMMALGVLAADLLFSHTLYARRVLPFWQLAGLLLFMFSNHVIGALAAHLRSHRREPLMAPLAITTLIALPLIVWAAAHYSSAELVIVLASMNFLVNLPVTVFVWSRCNRLWRLES
ncbi:conserved hypothetical protein-putative transmembrane protein [Candidatus Paraburkholderia calva]|nr:conserved hypothetical protein-putative transmembrane protein [Candidatus Paraburkholderia calva]